MGSRRGWTRVIKKAKVPRQLRSQVLNEISIGKYVRKKEASRQTVSWRAQILAVVKFMLS